MQEGMGYPLHYSQYLDSMFLEEMTMTTAEVVVKLNNADLYQGLFCS